MTAALTKSRLEGGGFHNVSGRAEFDKGHIPSAGFADLKGDLCDAESPIEFAMPTPEQFCAAMGVWCGSGP